MLSYGTRQEARGRFGKGDISLVCDHPRAFKALVASATVRAKRAALDTHHCEAWRRELNKCACDTPLQVSAPVLPFFQCEQCPFICPSGQQFRAHMSKAHKRNDAPTTLAAGSISHVCLKDFHVQPRLAQHVRNSPSCRFTWAHSRMRPREEEVMEARGQCRAITSENRAKGGPDHFAERPPIQWYGPPVGP
eukprot:2632723-Pyramimonas_sp.AAC.3